MSKKFRVEYGVEVNFQKVTEIPCSEESRVQHEH